MAVTWQVELKYTPAGAWDDITSKVFLHTIRRFRHKHKDLKPESNRLTFALKFDSSVLTSLLANDDVEIRVHKNAVDYFTGTVRHNFDVDSEHRVQPIKVECIDWSEKLHKRMKWTGSWIDYDVIDTADTDHSIVHQLLVQADVGISLAAGTSSIAKTIPYYTNVDGVDDVEFWDAITKVLFEFGYVWDIDASGAMTIFNFLPTDSSTSDSFNRDTNIREKLRLTKKRETYDGIEVKWWKLATSTGVVIFKDTTGGASGAEMNVTVAAGDFFPDPDGGDIYAEYEYDGKEIVYATNVDLVFAPTAKFTENTLTNYYKRALVEIENTSGAAAVLTKFHITGDVTYRKDIKVVRSEGYILSDDKLKIEAEHIYANADAEKLTTGLRRYYQYSDFRYALKSDADYEPGGFVDLVDGNLGINQRCWIVAVEDYLVNNDTEMHVYELEALEEYVAETPTTINEAVPVNPPPVADEPQVINAPIGSQPNTTPASGDTKTFIDPAIPEFAIQEHNGEGWEYRFRAGKRSGSNVVDMLLSGYFQAGESVLSSPGLIWTDKTIPTFGEIKGIAYGSSVWVIVGDTGDIARSTDGGDSWGSLITNPFSATTTIWDVAFGNSVFVAVGSNAEIARSTDSGASWGSLIATTLTDSIYGIAYGNGVWVAVGYSAANGGEIARSTNDGATWGALVSNPFTTSAIYAIAYANSIFVAVGNLGKISRSTDNGATWSALITNPFSAGESIQDVAYGDGVWIAVGTNGEMARSTDDGLTWGSLLTTPFGTDDLYGVSYGEGVWIAVSRPGEIARSTDGGRTWGSQVYGSGGVSYSTITLGIPRYSEEAKRWLLGGYGSGTGALLASDWLEAGSGIVARGSNANGWYHLYSDGSARGGCRNFATTGGGPFTWTFPYTGLTANPTCQISARDSNTPATVQLTKGTQSATQQSLWTSGNCDFVDLTFDGFWK